MSETTGRVAVITGGSRGIGAAAARLLASEGWSIVINYINDASAAHAVADDVQRCGTQVVVVQADISKLDDVQRLFDISEDKFGGISALVNSAGIVGDRARFIENDPANLARVIEVNVLGTMYCSLRAVRALSTATGGRGGSIVNISSGLSNTGGALSTNPVFLPDSDAVASGARVAYATSKGAINSFTTALAQEVAREGIRVNTVSPGPTRTAMVDVQRLSLAERRIPIGRVAEPKEIAEAICWLLSEKASYVSGAYLRVGGGLLG